jgi:guanine deaminase
LLRRRILIDLSIDTHIHASQYPNAGIFGKTTLLDWLNTYTFPLESSLSDATKARKVYSRCISRTLSHGTTTASYYATISVTSTNLLADLCLAAGQRAFIGRVCMDSLAPAYYLDASPEASVKDTIATIDYIKSIDPSYNIVSPIITPRFAPSCSTKLLTGLGKLAKETNLPIQTHISENAGEIALVKELFPGHAHYTATYDNHGLLGPRTILAHAVHLSEDERTMISARKAKISHCPVSNSSITSGAARVRWLLEADIDVGLGTDMSGGYSPSILEAARQSLLVSRHVAMNPDHGDDSKLSVEEVLYLATRGGAKCVGLESKIGGFEVGMEWDAQLIALSSVSTEGTLAAGEYGEADFGMTDIFGWETWDEKVAKWVFSGDDRNTRAVWVQGRLVHQR